MMPETLRDGAANTTEWMGISRRSWLERELKIAGVEGNFASWSDTEVQALLSSAMRAKINQEERGENGPKRRRRR